MDGCHLLSELESIEGRLDDLIPADAWAVYAFRPIGQPRDKSALDTTAFGETICAGRQDLIGYAVEPETTGIGLGFGLAGTRGYTPWVSQHRLKIGYTDAAKHQGMSFEWYDLCYIPNAKLPAAYSATVACTRADMALEAVMAIIKRSPLPEHLSLLPNYGLGLEDRCLGFADALLLLTAARVHPLLRATVDTISGRWKTAAPWAGWVPGATYIALDVDLQMATRCVIEWLRSLITPEIAAPPAVPSLDEGTPAEAASVACEGEQPLTPNETGPDDTVPHDGQYVFTRKGEYWQLVFEGQEKHFEDSKGLQYIAYLLDAYLRGEHKSDVGINELWLAVNPPPKGDYRAAVLAAATPDELAKASISVSDLGDQQEVIDPTAKRAYEFRLGMLEKDYAAAQERDPADVAEIKEEIGEIQKVLRLASDWRGLPRSMPNVAERKRKGIGMAISRALARIDKKHEALGQHLRNSVKTGWVCRYTPERDLPWVL